MLKLEYVLIAAAIAVTVASMMLVFAPPPTLNGALLEQIGHRTAAR